VSPALPENKKGDDCSSPQNPEKPKPAYFFFLAGFFFAAFFVAIVQFSFFVLNFSRNEFIPLLNVLMYTNCEKNCQEKK
jgi:hypothetical protein